MTKLLKAKSIREKALHELKRRTSVLLDQGITPTLKVFLVGEHPASILYTNNKKKFVESFGAKCEILKLDETIQESEFIKKLNDVSSDSQVHGSFVQLPLPSHLGHIDVGQFISPEKDIDGFHMKNIYELVRGGKGHHSLIPCTPRGIITLLQENNIEIKRKKIVVIGRSMIVGKPTALLLNNYNATVTVCHGQTENLFEHTHQADIIIVAIGHPHFFNRDILNPTRNDQIVIDVGINKDENGKTCGDVKTSELLGHCAAITPVPGSVGPMTILSLAQNLIEATERQTSK